jgi:hypothetical protein
MKVAQLLPSDLWGKNTLVNLVKIILWLEGRKTRKKKNSFGNLDRNGLMFTPQFIKAMFYNNILVYLYHVMLYLVSYGILYGITGITRKQHICNLQL